MTTATDALRELFELKKPSLSFKSQPEAIPGDLRLSWRLVMTCMLLDKCWGSKTNIQTMHVLWWAVRSATTRELFIRWLNGENQPDELLVRFDPAVTTTLDLAIGSRLVEARGSEPVVALTDVGKLLVEAAWADTTVLIQEKAFLQALPKKLSQRAIRSLLDWR